MAHRYFQTVVGADDTSAGDATELKWELEEDLVRCDDRGPSIRGCLLLFWFRSQTLIVFWMMYV